MKETKYYCDLCGNEVEGDELVKFETAIGRRIDYPSKDVLKFSIEICEGCIKRNDLARGYVTGVETRYKLNKI